MTKTGSTLFSTAADDSWKLTQTCDTQTWCDTYTSEPTQLQNAISDGFSTVVLIVGGWMDRSPGGSRYRAPYGANNERKDKNDRYIAW